MKSYVVDNSIGGDSYRYESDKGIISMITPCLHTLYTYEIYCIRGNLFDDVEKYSTLYEALDRITELIGKEFKFGR